MRLKLPQQNVFDICCALPRSSLDTLSVTSRELRDTIATRFAVDSGRCLRYFETVYFRYQWHWSIVDVHFSPEVDGRFSKMHLDYRHTFLALRGAYIGELRINEERATVLSEELSKAIAESAPFIHIAKIYWTYSTRYSTSDWALISPLLTFARLDVLEWSKSGDDAPPHCEKMLRECAKAGVAELTLNNSLWKFGRLPANEDVIQDFIFGKTPLNEVYASTNGNYRVFYMNYAPISGDFFLKFVQRLSDTSFSHGLNVNLNRVDVNRLLELDLGRYDAAKTVNRSKECVLIEIDLNDTGRKATFRIVGSNYFGYKSRIEVRCEPLHRFAGNPLRQSL